MSKILTTFSKIFLPKCSSQDCRLVPIIEFQSNQLVSGAKKGPHGAVVRALPSSDAVLTGTDRQGDRQTDRLTDGQDQGPHIESR